MKVLNTEYPTWVYDDYLLDPSIMDKLSKEKRKKKCRVLRLLKQTMINFVKEVASGFLQMNGFEHNKDKWYMDVIRYSLENDVKRVKSGLAWHCENDNYPNVITVLLYLRIDDGIKEGNIRYKDKNGVKYVFPLKSGTTVFMDGNVPHTPQDPYGSGRRDFIIVSFEK